MSPQIANESRDGRALVRCCTFCLDDVDEFDFYSLVDLLDHSERARAERLIFSHDQRRFVVAHAYKRKILGRWLGISPPELKFTSDQFGKPMLANTPVCSRLAFSLSHSGSWAMVAVGAIQRLGVDIEQVRQLHNIEQLANSFLSQEELATVDVSDVRSVLRVWTLKEAILKATGEGLSRPFSTLNLKGISSKCPTLHRLDGQDPSRWRLALLPFQQNFVASIAAETCGANLEVVMER